MSGVGGGSMLLAAGSCTVSFFALTFLAAGLGVFSATAPSLPGLCSTSLLRPPHSTSSTSTGLRQARQQRRVCRWPRTCWTVSGLSGGTMTADKHVQKPVPGRAAQPSPGCQHDHTCWLGCWSLMLVPRVSCLCVVQPLSISPAWVRAPSSAKPPRQPQRSTSSPPWQDCTQMSRQQGDVCP